MQRRRARRGGQRSISCHRGLRVHRETLTFAIDETAPASAGLLSDRGCPNGMMAEQARGRPKRYPLSQPALPMPIRKASRRGRRGAVAFSSWLGGEGQCSNPCLWGRLIRFTVSNQPSLLQELPQPHKQTSPFPLCASARVLPHPEPQCLQRCPNGLFGRALAGRYPKR